MIYAIYEINTGKLYSTGTVIANPMPEHLASKLLTDQEANDLANGGIWDEINHTVLSPPPNIPENISARQIRLWLIQHSISLQAVTDAINTIEDQILRDSIAIEWEYAPYIERSHPMLIPLATALGLSPEQVDQAFIEASQI